MEFQGQGRQDEFVANLLNFKRNGYYLDIGSCHAVSTNNTYYFESLGWCGICIERNPEHNESYASRTCHFLNEDATKIDYGALLDSKKCPPLIDYLSLDIDEHSTTVLEMLPLDRYRFGAITIEHDCYQHGNEFSDVQRAILTKHNYILLCEDVLVPLETGMGPDCAFEDWWIDPSILSADKVERVVSKKMYPKRIISLLISMGT